MSEEQVIPNKAYLPIKEDNPILESASMKPQRNINDENAILLSNYELHISQNINALDQNSSSQSFSINDQILPNRDVEVI